MSAGGDGGYRSELAAAHARIAKLEETIAELRAQKTTSADDPAIQRVLELANEVERCRRAADEGRFGWLGLLFVAPGAVIVIGGALLFRWQLAPPIGLVVVMLGRIALARLKRARGRALRDAELRLAEAKKVNALERRVASMVRVSDDRNAADLAIDESDSSDATSATKAEPRRP